MSVTQPTTKQNKPSKTQTRLAEESAVLIDPSSVPIVDAASLMPDAQASMKQSSRKNPGDDEDELSLEEVLSDATFDETDADASEALAYIPQDASGHELIELAQADQGKSDAGGAAGMGFDGTGLAIGALIVGGIVIAENNNDDDDPGAGPSPESEPEPEGKTFDLTVNADTSPEFTGTDVDDTYNGAAGTLGDDDELDGGDGTDTLNAVLAGVSVAPTLTSIEVLNLTSETGASTLSLLNATGVLFVNNNGSSQNLTVTDIAQGTDLSVNNVNNVDTVFTFVNVDKEDAYLTVNDVGNTNQTKVTLNNTSGTVYLTSLGLIGGNNLELLGATNNITSVYIDGTNDLVLTAANATLVNAETLSGDLTFSASNVSTTVVGGSGDDSITGGENNDYLIGGAGVDTIAGGNGADIIVGGSGNDVLNGGNGTDRYIFESTAALNGVDTITLVSGGGGDVLDFSAFLSGGSVAQNGAAGNSINEFTSANNADFNITNKVVLFHTNGAALTSAELVAEIQGANNAFSIDSGGKAIVITGDATAPANPANIFYIDDSLDGVSGTISETDVVVVAVTSTNFDVDSLQTVNFTFLALA